MNGDQQTSLGGGGETGGADQARLELAMAAATAERSNRPKAMVAGALVLLVIALIYTGSGVAARSAAMGRVEAQRTETKRVLAIKAKVDALRQQQATRGLAANSRVGKALEDLAAAAGLKADASGKQLVIPESDLTGVAVPGVSQKKYTARMTGQDPKAIMEWLANVQAAPDTQGVEISVLTLKPDVGANAGGWSLDVEFVRWERK